MAAHDDDQAYFRERKRQCLEMAARASDPGIQHIHRRLAEAYARRLEAETEQHQIAA